MMRDSQLIRLKMQPTSGRDSKSEGRTVSGLAVPYDVEFQRFGVRLVFREGGLNWLQPVDRIKYLVSHDDDRPAGYASAVTSSAEGVRMTLALPGHHRSDALADEIELGLRDGLSVGVALDSSTTEAIWAELWDESGALIEATGTIVEISAVTVPQFESARVDQARQLVTLTRKGTDMPEIQATAAMPTSAPIEPGSGSAAIPAPAAAAVATARATSRPVSAALELAGRITAAKLEGGEGKAMAVMQTIEAALADITPAGNGAGNEIAGLAVQAVGELVDDTAFETLYESTVVGASLTGAKVTGWRWKVPPTTGAYAGNKAEIPTNAATLEWVEKQPSRLAGGHDIDRIYKDLGSAEMLASYWRIMTADLLQKYDDARLAAITAAAGTAGTAGSTAEAILAGITAVKGATYVIVAQDLASAEGAKPLAELPAAFQANNLFTNTIPSNIIVSPDITSKVIVGRRSAVTFYSLQPPVRLEALVLAKGGIDTGLYGYYGDLVAQLGGVKQYTVTPPLPLGASSAKK